ncbi:MAG: PEP-CTERM system TPR-repeat protein PrsT [Burkholderiales bacterium]|nr:PEP-CTERM system TPR-repeat protein PrsT [Burkholderiales bacterium]MDE2398234.1 PEP-CTERM system TPR-repeat protein PrsT [Burkholderiales bacterium]
MRIEYRRRLRVAAAALLAVGALAGCGDQSEGDLLASARSYIAKGDDKAASIELKTALQQNPASGQARFLLGDTLLRMGDPAAAEVELDKAQSLHYDDNEVLPRLAQAMLTNGEMKKVADLYSSVKLSDPVAAARLKVSVARAHFALGQFEPARAAVDAAMQLDPKNIDVRLLHARMTAGGGDIDGALAAVKAIVADAPKYSPGWQLEGELLWVGKGDADNAIKALRQAIAATPRYLPAYSALISIQLQRQDLAGFRATLADLTKALPTLAETHFYQTQLALIDKDYPRAREGVQQLLRVAPQNVRVLQLAAAIEFESGSLVVAENYLRQALQLDPNLSFARGLLAETDLRSNEPDRALAVLKPALDGAQPDIQVLSLAAQAYLQKGNLQAAQEYFVRAGKTDPNNTQVRTALALTEILKGNAVQGFGQLEAISRSDKGNYADLALISALLQRNDSDGALQAIDRLAKKMPEDPLPEQLRGSVLLRRKDDAGARAAFERALGHDKVYYPAIAALGDLDLREGKLDAARKRFQDVLAANPKNYQALLSLVRVREALGAKPEEIGSMLADAAKAHPGEAVPWLMLIDHRLDQHDARGALAAAQDASANLPDDPRLYEALGRAQLASGDVQQAISAFGKLAAAQPDSAQPQLRLAQAYLQGKDKANAERSLKAALAITPDLLVAQRGLIQIMLADKRFDEALAVARTVQKQRPDAGFGYVLEGDVRIVQRDWNGAITAIEAAVARSDESDLAIRLQDLYLTAGRGADAERQAKAWMAAHPKDIAFLFHLASNAAARKNWAAAEDQYRRALAIDPKSVSALNNIAWLMAQQKEPGAVAMAEKAMALFPNEAMTMDTLAFALAAEGQLAKAIEWQKKAIAAKPDAPQLHLNLAKLLIQSGDRAGARTELEALQKQGASFAGHTEVASLLASM